jgi:hypothetical protein
MNRVLLVSMPWNRADYPSIQIGLLKGHLVRRGVEVRALYPYLNLAGRLGHELYLKLADKLNPILGESLFAAMLTTDPNLEKRGNRLLVETEELTAQDVHIIRSELRGFIDELMEADLWSHFDLVGFTCSFNQVYASLLAAKKLKQRHPDTRVVLGGVGMYGEAGRSYFNACGFLDYVVSGPGEDALMRLVTEQPSGRIFIEAPPTNPGGHPNYDEYFASSPVSPNASVVLRASIGCDFGACAFCAQNMEVGHTCRESEEVLREVESAVRTYSTSSIEFSDTCFPLSLFQDDWPTKMERLNAKCFAQMRTFGSSRQAAAIKRAGFDQVQVGIESFHPRILKNMNKPSGLLENIQCLRVGYENDINVDYNLILDFPGTTNQDLEEMAAILPSLHHLPPPTALVPFALHHDSLVHRHPNRYGLDNIRPHHFYDAVSPGFSTGQLVPLFYEFDVAESVSKSALYRIDKLCRAWISNYDSHRPALAIWADRESVKILDRRDRRASSSYTVPDFAIRALAILDQPTSLTDYEQQVGNAELAVQGLSWLRRRRLIAEDGRRALALPVKEGPRSLYLPDELDSYFVDTTPGEN